METYKMKLLLILVFSTCALADNADRSRIVGGYYATAGQFPYQVSQRYNGQHNCGGSIINNKTILTAAQCVDGQDVSLVDIVVGSVTLEDGFWHVVSHYIMHENYDSHLLKNDIALIEVVWPIQFMPTIQPIALDSNYINAGASSVVAGWGLTSYPGNQPSYYLLYFFGYIYDLKQCQRALQGVLNYPVLDTNICSYAQRGQGVCRGDGGGGLVVNGKLVGISSWGKMCARGVPDVFTRVSSFIYWINTH